MKKLILAAAVSLIPTFVHAQNFRDWRVVQETDAVLQVPVCRAYTQVTSNLPIAVELSLSFPTAFDHPPIMILKVPGNSQIQRAVVPFSSREIEDLLIFEAVTDPTQQDKLWYVPVQMEKMVDIIIGNNNLPLQFVLANKEEAGRISLSGSAAAMNQIARCLRVDEILPTRFFKELNTEAGQAPLGPDQSVGQLMKYVDQAFAHYRSIAKTEDDLKKLRATMRTLLSQEAEAQRGFNSAQAALDRATQAAGVTREKIRKGEERLQQIPGEVQTLQQQKTAAEQLMAQKKAAYDPLRQQAAPYERAVDQARSEVNSISREIRERESTISEGNAKIARLQNEARRLDGEIDDLDRQIGPLERKKSELETDLAAYNIEWEKQKILNNDWRYRNLKDERERIRRELPAKRGDLQRERQELNRAEAALRNCLSRPNPQCAAEQAEVDRNRNSVNRLENEVRNLESRLSSVDRDLDRLEWDAQNEAARGRDRIADELRRVAGEVADKRSAKERAQDRAREINSFEIPGLQREVSQAQSQLPGLRRDLGQAQRELATAETDLQRWKTSVDFDRIEREFVDARKSVQQIGAAIAERQEEQAQITRNLPGWRSQLQREEREVTRLTAPRDTAKTKLDGIQAQLAPYRAQEKNLTDALAVLKPQYDELRALYQTLAKTLL